MFGAKSRSDGVWAIGSKPITPRFTSIANEISSTSTNSEEPPVQDRMSRPKTDLLDECVEDLLTLPSPSGQWRGRAGR